MNNEIADDEVYEIFTILSKYYHTTDKNLIKTFLLEDLISFNHTSRLFSFYESDPRKLIEAIIMYYGQDIINRKITNTIKKIVNQNKTKQK